MLQATDIRGIVPPVTTPLTENDAVDREGVARLIDWFIDAGCVGIFAIGSSGEGPSLTREMRYEMVDACADALGGRIPLLAGVSSPSYKESVMQAEQVAELGADAIVATCPYYFFYGQSQLRDYFEALTEASPLPLVIYDIPARSDNDLEVHTVLELADNDRIIGIKDSTGNIERGVNIVNALEGREDFTIMQGSEQLLGMAALMGYHGAVMGMANACPKLFVALLEAGRAGDVQKTRELQETVNNAFPYFFAAEPGTRNIGSIVGAMKTAQELQGLIDRRLLFPARQVTDEDVSRIKVLLDPLAEAGWIEFVR
ncbi:MAG: dihydrodipicolinate synthase family protein [Armatimonadota bacterium]